MTKRRNPQAVAAWTRHGGAHDAGSKRPEADPWADIAEGLDEALEDTVGIVVEGMLEIDGELYEIEFCLDDDEEDGDE